MKAPDTCKHCGGPQPTNTGRCTACQHLYDEREKAKLRFRRRDNLYTLGEWPHGERANRNGQCDATATHPQCGPYRCALPTGHTGSQGTACRKHHGSLILWTHNRGSWTHKGSKQPC